MAFVVAGGTARATRAQPAEREVAVGALRSWPPHYSLDDDGQPTGFAIDVIDEVAARAHLRTHYVLFDTFADMEHALEAREIDVIPNFGDTRERRAQLAFTPPVETFFVVLFVRAGTTGVRGVEDLRGRRVAVVRTNVAVGLLAREDVDTVIYEDVPPALFDLLAGRVDAFAYPESVVTALAREAGVSDRIRRVGAPLAEVKRALAVRRDDTELLARLTAAVEGFEDSPRYQEVYRHWYGDEPAFWTVSRVLWVAGLIVAVLLAGFVVLRLRLLARHNLELRARIAERDAAQAALGQSEAQYRRMVEISGEGVWEIDAEGVTTFVNRRMAEMLGLTPEQMIGRPFFDFFDEALAAEARANLERRLDGVSELHDFRLRHADGTERIVLMSATPVTEDGEVRGALAMVTDITDRRRLEQQVEKSQRIEALGRLAGGVAHDFNNLILVINANVSLARAALSRDHPVASDLAQIEEAAERAGSLTSQLLAFSRRTVTKVQVVEPTARIAETAALLRRLLGEDIALELPREPVEGRVAIDPVHLDQVIFNLVSNAGDAMPDGGRVEITAEDVSLDESGEVPAGDYVRISVEDDGAGMSPEVLENIFEPFFTTKPSGQGTGLGLATCYGLVTQAKGHIRVTSRPGEGTSFRVYLPRVEASVEAPAEAREPTPATGATVLLVEDEPAVRRAVRRMLERAGHGVLEATSPTHALELFRAHRDEIDVLLTDIVMPEMNGRELARRIRAEMPELRIVYMSGHTDRALRDLQELDDREAFLAKPFVSEDLLRVLHPEEGDQRQKVRPGWG